MKRKRKKRKKQWGWGKSGYYKGTWCDSSWELAYLMYHLDHDIKIRRNGRGFVYTYYGKKHKYYPDFVVNGEYVEIKGRMDRKSKAKIKQFKKLLIVIEAEGIKPYLEYATKTYGDDFTKLYSSTEKKKK